MIILAKLLLLNVPINVSYRDHKSAIFYRVMKPWIWKGEHDVISLRFTCTGQIKPKWVTPGCRRDEGRARKREGDMRGRKVLGSW